jgi:hypothetical protein
MNGFVEDLKQTASAVSKDVTTGIAFGAVIVLAWLLLKDFK